MNPVLKDYATHLEFLGYEITPQDDENSVFAKHATHGNTFVKAYLSGVLLQQYYRVSDKAKTARAEFLEVVNQLNSTANVATFVAGSSDDLLRIDGLFLGAYDRQRFGLFVEKYNYDATERVLGNEMVRSFIA
jgi:hypothetical protein